MKKIKSLLRTCLIIAFSFAFSQTKISKEEAFEWAKTNNPNQKILDLQHQKLQKLIGSQQTYAPLNIGAEYGQMNSLYKDNRVSLSQEFLLPKYYSSQKKVLEMEWQNFESIKKLQNWQLKKTIYLLFNENDYLNAKLRFFQKTDSIFANYLARTQNRLKNGETNAIERSLAENWKNQSAQQLQSLKIDSEILDLKLNLLINQNQIYTFKLSKWEVLPSNFITINALNSEFLLQNFKNDIQLQQLKLSAEKTKNLPSFSLTANSMTMFGMGANEVLYDFSQRFNSVAVGLNLPIINKSKKSLVEAQKLNILIAQQELKNQELKLNYDFLNKKMEYDKWKNEINNYENHIKENQEKIINTAARQLKQGEIQYLDYFIIISQLFDNESKNIDKIKWANDALIELNALVEKN